MKFFIESHETASRWEFEIDADKETIEDLLNSKNWSNVIEEKYLSDDWSKRRGGFIVFDLEDDEISKIVSIIKTFFEDEGNDTEDIRYILEDSQDDDLEEEDEEYIKDLFEELSFDD